MAASGTRSLGEADDGGCPGLSFDDAQELAARILSGALGPPRTRAVLDDVIDETAAAALVEAIRSSRFKPPPIDLAALARDLSTAKRLCDARLRRWRPSRTVIEALDRLATSRREPHDQLAVIMADTTGRHLLCWGWSFLKAASGDVLGAAAAEATLTRIAEGFNELRLAAQIAHRLAEDAPSAEQEILDTNIEYDLIGRILPSIYEHHFKRRFGVSRIQRRGVSGSRLIGRATPPDPGRNKPSHTRTALDGPLRRRRLLSAKLITADRSAARVRILLYRVRGHPRGFVIGSKRCRRRVEAADFIAALTSFDLRAHLLPVHRSLLSPRHCNTMIGFMFRLDVTSAERPHRPEGFTTSSKDRHPGLVWCRKHPDVRR
jgi:hypothetical protein